MYLLGHEEDISLIKDKIKMPAELYDKLKISLLKVDEIYGKDRDVLQDDGGFALIIEDDDNIKEEFYKHGIGEVYEDYFGRNRGKVPPFENEMICYDNNDHDKNFVECFAFCNNDKYIVMIMSYKVYRENIGTYLYDDLLG